MYYDLADPSVTNSENVTCFSDCSSNTDNGTIDITTDDENECCAVDSITTGYGTNTTTCDAPCKFCCIATYIDSYTHYIANLRIFNVQVFMYNITYMQKLSILVCYPFIMHMHIYVHS